MFAKFKLLAGKDHTGSAKNGTRVTIRPGQVFEAHSKKHEEFCRKYPDRYLELEPSAKVTVPEFMDKSPSEPQEQSIEINLSDLEKMNEQQLLQFCRENGIDVGRAVRKQDILNEIKKQLS